jgi:hypothetical protein
MKLRVTLYSACVINFWKTLYRIYNRISPIIEENLPIEQAGFRLNRRYSGKKKRHRSKTMADK